MIGAPSFPPIVEFLPCRKTPRPARIATLDPLLMNEPLPRARLSEATARHHIHIGAMFGDVGLERRPFNQSWISLGMVMCATVRLDSAVLTVSTTLLTCAGPMMRSLYAATSLYTRSRSTSCW